MVERSKDWLKQAEADFKHTVNSINNGDFDWACFAAHQAAEKAIKALFQSFHKDAWGHTVSLLLGEISETSVPNGLINKAKKLDKHYILARYPNSFETGAPTDYFTKDDATEALNDAKEIIEFCKSNIGQ